MKLHLPKGLFVAVMAACSLGSVSQAANTWGSNNGKPGQYYYFDQATFREIDATEKGNRVNLVADKANFSSSASITVAKDITLAVCSNPWPDYHVFNHLLLTQVDVVDKGSVALEVKDGVTTTINKVGGALSSVTISNDSTLTLGAATVGNVTNTGTFNIAGTITGATEDAAISGPVNVVVDNKSTTIMNYEGITYRNADGTAASGNSGFVMGEQTLTIFKGISQTSGAFTINGQEATLAADGTYTYDAGTATTLFIVDDSWTYNAKQSQGAEEYYVTAKGTLDFTTAGEHTLPSVSGVGNLQVSSTDSEVQLTVTSISDFTGGITVTKGTAAAILNLSGINGTLGAKSIALAGGTLSLDVAQGTTTTYANSITGNGQLTKTGAGTLKLTGNTPFTGTIDVQAGELRAGGSNITFDVSKIIVRDGSKFTTDFKVSTSGESKKVAANIDLMSGSTLYNDDGHVAYNGTIRANIVDPSASEAEYNADGEVTIASYWGKNLYLAGLLEGSGTINLHNTYFTGTGNDREIWYHLQNDENTFNGTYKLADNGTGNTTGDTINLYIVAENAAQYASVNLASSQAVSKLILNTSASIVGLDGSDADNIVTTNGANATISVQQGSFGGKLQDDGDAKLALSKVGDGTLTLSGANTYSGGTTIKKGILALSGNGTLGTGLVTIEKDGTLKTNGSTATMSVTGAGTIDLGNRATLNATLDSNWTGTVKMSGATLGSADNKATLSDYGNANSTIRFDGTSQSTGYFATESVNPNIELNGNDQACLDLASGQLTFTGKVSGGGNMGTSAGAASEVAVTFTGDVSEWTGVYWAAKATDITYSGNAKSIKNTLTAGEGAESTVTFVNTSGMTVDGGINNQKWSNGTLNLKVQNGENAAGTVVFNGEVFAGKTGQNKTVSTNLTVGEGASAKFTNANVKLTAVTLEKDASLTFVNVKDPSLATLSLGEGASLSVGMNSIGVTGSVTLNSGASITASEVDLTAATRVTFAVAMGEGSAIALNGAALTMKDGNQFMVALGNSLTDLAEGESLTLFTGVSGLTVGDSLVFTGDITSIDLSAWDTSLEEGKYTLSYVIDDTTRAASVGGSLVLTAAIPVVDPGEDPSNPGGGNTNIPEPTTATLSLLALCGLAARRRRRA